MFLSMDFIYVAKYVCLIVILVQLMGTSTEFKGFFIQARAEKDQESVSSIVGTWNPLNTEARTQNCNNVKKVNKLTLSTYSYINIYA